MESYPQSISQSQDQTKQANAAKRSAPTTLEEAFEGVSSKADVYDHMKNRLQVSYFV